MRNVKGRAKGPDFVKYLHEFVLESIGNKGLAILLSMGEGATDEIIEQKTKLKIAEIRSILNHLHSYGFVEYSREKNMQNGWFTYTWKVNVDRAMQNFLMIKKKEVERLREGVEASEGAMLYRCRKGCSKFHFDTAMENKFRCPTCSSDMKYLDTQDELKKAEIRINAIQKILSARGELPDRDRFTRNMY
jgi:transcription factor E